MRAVFESFTAWCLNWNMYSLYRILPWLCKCLKTWVKIYSLPNILAQEDSNVFSVFILPDIIINLNSDFVHTVIVRDRTDVMTMRRIKTSVNGHEISDTKSIQSYDSERKMEEETRSEQEYQNEWGAAWLAGANIRLWHLYNRNFSFWYTSGARRSRRDSLQGFLKGL